MSERAPIRILFRVALVLLPLFSGTLLQTVQFPFLGRVENLFWGLIFGFGWFVMGNIAGYGRLSGMLGFFVWPGLICITLFLLSGWLWHKICQKAARWLIFLFFLSLFAVFPFHEGHSSTERLPLFDHILNWVFD
ncbi:MAG TPA: hypothetical protein VGF97_19300 [Rhizomicrobium sp.]|jgi:hypothetical protein